MRKFKPERYMESMMEQITYISLNFKYRLFFYDTNDGFTTFF